MSTADPTASMTPEELIAVVTAGLDADERTAREAGDETTKWYLSTDGDLLEEPGSPVAIGPWGAGIDPEGEHIARHDPSRVLADVQAKREILEWCKTEEYEATTSGDLDMGYEQGYRDASAGYLRILRALARPYLDQDTP